jgi:hypothetical protein
LKANPQLDLLRFSDIRNHQPAGKVAVVYAISDFFFYSSGETFFEIFSSMFQSSTHRYQGDTMTEVERAEWRRLVQLYYGLRISCLGKDQYAPKPRKNDPEKISHGVKVFPKLSKRSKSAMEKALDFADPSQDHITLQRRLLPTPGMPAKENLICGCKFALGSYAQKDRTRGGVGWKNPEVRRRPCHHLNQHVNHHLLLCCMVLNSRCDFTRQNQPWLTTL